MLKDLTYESIKKMCEHKPQRINFEEFTPSWYIYTDCDNNVYVKNLGDADADLFFTNVSKKIAFDDCTNETVHKIFYKGKEVEYAGWQPCMRFEYKDLDGNTVWVGQFEHWDH